jgi:hypothetical protein
MHNDEGDEYQFSHPHAVICIANVAEADSGREWFINLTTAWSILNLGRCLRPGWPNTLCSDGTGKSEVQQEVGHQLWFPWASFPFLQV